MVTSTPLRPAPEFDPTESAAPPLSRKRQRRPETWKQNIAKRKREDGQAYASRDGTERPPKVLKKPKSDHHKCSNKCARTVDSTQQQAIFTYLWNLGAKEKKLYYQKTIQCSKVNSRNRTNFKSKRTVKNSYYVESSRNYQVKVCKEFYECIHGISHARITTFLKNRDSNGIPKSRVVHSPPTKYGSEVIEGIRSHINSFPRIESHYCRANSKRLYLESSLSLSRMYQLYKNKMIIQGEERIASRWKYDEIFSTEFNISFHKPKKDRCDKCERWKVLSANGGMLEADTKEKAAHDKSRLETRAARHRDMSDPDPNVLLVSFDLENVFALPRMNVSSAFYKRKLNTYNMTAVVNKTKKGYCAVWPESLIGRSGNEMASAVSVLLKEIVSDHPDAHHIVLWSDSCVPQNRNSIMSYALQHLIETTTQISTITQRFCEPGHSDIQDVDNLHSQLSRALSEDLDIHSPVSLI